MSPFLVSKDLHTFIHIQIHILYIIHTYDIYVYILEAGFADELEHRVLIYVSLV